MLNAYSGPIIFWYSAFKPHSEWLYADARPAMLGVPDAENPPKAEARSAVALVAWRLRKLSFEYSAAPATEAVTASNSAAVIIRFIGNPRLVRGPHGRTNGGGR